MEEQAVAPFRDAMPVGVVVERRRLNNPWQDESWLPIAVLPGASAAGWRVLHEDGERLQAYAGTLPVELFRKETASYKHNLETATPQVYVVLRPSDDPIWPWPPPPATVATRQAPASLHGRHRILAGV